MVVIFFFGGPRAKLVDIVDIPHCWWAVAFEVQDGSSPASFEFRNLTGALAVVTNVSKQTTLPALS
jgi:hypothetical protein